MQTTKVINAFPGYEYVNGKNLYRGTDLGKGGYIISNPGIYTDVALLDVASLHPSSIIAMNCFGEYTQHFNDLLNARIAIKHGDFDTAKKMMNGRLEPYLDDESTAKDLAQALKIAINSCYGLTAANFDNPFRDIRNKNNIVALRGALFMKTLQDEVEKRGFKIVAIKTDSIKIADATEEIVDFCMSFANQYSYTFEFEAFYDRICQINDADYVARYKSLDGCESRFNYIPGDNKKHPEEWTVTGKRFAVPYVFKTLFSKDPITMDDMRETFSVKSALYLDMNEKLPDVSEYEKEREKLFKKINNPARLDENMDAECERIEELSKRIAEGHDYKFIGRVGEFCPVKPGMGGGLLMREQNGKYNAAAGTTGYRWLEAETLLAKGNEDYIDRSYYQKLVDDAVDAISQYGDFEWFTSDDLYIPEQELDDLPPWEDGVEETTAFDVR